jgi:hypothetical protein
MKLVRTQVLKNCPQDDRYRQRIPFGLCHISDKNEHTGIEELDKRIEVIGKCIGDT